MGRKKKEKFNIEDMSRTDASNWRTTNRTCSCGALIQKGGICQRCGKTDLPDLYEEDSSHYNDRMGWAATNGFFDRD